MAAVFHAPGRGNLIGALTDHTDGLVLLAAIDRGIALTCDLEGERIRLRSAPLNSRDTPTS